MLEEELRRVARLGGLLRREVPLLPDRKLKEAIPVRSGFEMGGHVTRRNPWFSFVQTRF